MNKVEKLNDIFSNPAMMEKIGTIDRGIIAAIKNSAVIRWLLRFTTPSVRTT